MNIPDVDSQEVSISDGKLTDEGDGVSEGDALSKELRRVQYLIDAEGKHTNYRLNGFFIAELSIDNKC